MQPQLPEIASDHQNIETLPQLREKFAETYRKYRDRVLPFWRGLSVGDRVTMIRDSIEHIPETSEVIRNSATLFIVISLGFAH